MEKVRYLKVIGEDMFNLELDCFGKSAVWKKYLPSHAAIVSNLSEVELEIETQREENMKID